MVSNYSFKIFHEAEDSGKERKNCNIFLSILTVYFLRRIASM